MNEIFFGDDVPADTPPAPGFDELGDEQVTALFRIKNLRKQEDGNDAAPDNVIKISQTSPDDIDPEDIIIDEGWLE